MKKKIITFILALPFILLFNISTEAAIVDISDAQPGDHVIVDGEIRYVSERVTTNDNTVYFSDNVIPMTRSHIATVPVIAEAYLAKTSNGSFVFQYNSSVSTWRELRFKNGYRQTYTVSGYTNLTYSETDRTVIGRYEYRTYYYSVY